MAVPVLNSRVAVPSGTIIGIGEAKGTRAIVIHTEDVGPTSFQTLREPG